MAYLIYIGIVFAFGLISYALIHITKYLFRRYISKSNSVKKSIRLRLFFYIVRLVLKTALFLVGSILLIGLINITIYTFKVDRLYFHLSEIIGFIGMFIWLWSLFSLPVSMINISRFKNKYQNKKYVLYLRGFATDDYNPHLMGTAKKLMKYRPYPYKPYKEDDKDKKESNLTCLNERHLVKAWKHWYPVISVGRPNELESPEGSTRVYLDNSCWQDDVLYLMKNAQYILISTHSNDNCIWEIMQANSSFNGKTVYYVADVVNLKFIIDKMQDLTPKSLRLCYYEKMDIINGLDKLNNEENREYILDTKEKFCHIFAFQNNEEIYMQPYNNNFKGFEQTAQIAIQLLQENQTNNINRSSCIVSPENSVSYINY